MTKPKLSMEKINKQLNECDLKKPDSYRLILVKVVREAVTGMRDGTIPKAQALRILNKTVDIGCRYLETVSLAEELEELSAQVKELE